MCSLGLPRTKQTFKNWKNPIKLVEHMTCDKKLRKLDLFNPEKMLKVSLVSIFSLLKGAEEQEKKRQTASSQKCTAEQEALLKTDSMGNSNYI